MSDKNEKNPSAKDNASPRISPFDSSSNRHKMANVEKLPVWKDPDDEEGKDTGNEQRSDTRPQSE